ncbi:hypothetical protein DFJ77DRAFT_343125 [Powellomyces hirtus]|nr:hypothetical protein DFJ77DRAFT_343125 [Powellomyces hirtus]
MPPRVSSPVNPAPVVSVPMPNGEDDRYLSVNPLANGPRATRRLFDRHSAPNAEEQYAQLLGDMNQGDQHRRNPEDARHRVLEDRNAELSEEYAYKRSSYSSMRGPSPAPARGARSSAHMSPLLRPSTPIDDAIASADWSLQPIVKAPVDRPNSGLGNGTFSPVLGGLHDDLPNIGALSLQPPRSPYGRPLSPRPVSPIILSPPTPTGVNPPTLGHPSPGWGYVDVRSRTPNSHYSHSEYSDTYSHDGRHGDGYFERNGMLSAHKEKGKIPESVDLEALNGGCFQF